jgi:hypothetical protein
MNIGNMTTSIGKVFYAPLDETRYLNVEGYYRLHIKEIYDNTKLKDLLIEIIDKFQDYNGIVFIQNDDDSLNIIKSIDLINNGFVMTDSKENRLIYIYKYNDDASDVLFN